MKSLYPTVMSFCILFITTFFSSHVLAQCNCTGGVTPDSTIYYYTLATTNSPTSTISFPKFDPAVGTLNCVSFYDTISGVSTTGVRNLAGVKTQYKFQLTVANEIDGPGVSVSEVFNKIYGPDSLDIFGNPGDTITYGPDSVFQNITDVSTTSSVAGYLGSSGTVDFLYTINGGLLSLKGGLNYRDQIITDYWGNFKLVYFWCPAAALATGINHFNAFRKGSDVLLQWQSENELPSVAYEIQYSLNGRAFVPAGALTGNPHAAGTNAAYQFQFRPGENANGKIYVRVKRIEPGGKISYTSIKMVLMGTSGGAGFQVYPNPVVNYIAMQFDELQSGNYSMELVNTMGQLVRRSDAKLSGTNFLQMDIAQKPPSGVYYFRVRNTETNRVYVNKVIVQ